MDDHSSNGPTELVEHLIQVIRNRVSKTLTEREKARQEQEATDMGARMVRESVHLLVDKLIECRGTQATLIVSGIE